MYTAAFIPGPSANDLVLFPLPGRWRGCTGKRIRSPSPERNRKKQISNDSIHVYFDLMDCYGPHAYPWSAAFVPPDRSKIDFRVHLPREQEERNEIYSNHYHFHGTGLPIRVIDILD